MKPADPVSKLWSDFRFTSWASPEPVPDMPSGHSCFATAYDAYNNLCMEHGLPGRRNSPEACIDFHSGPDITYISYLDLDGTF